MRGEEGRGGKHCKLDSQEVLWRGLVLASESKRINKREEVGHRNMIYPTSTDRSETSRVVRER